MKQPIAGWFLTMTASIVLVMADPALSEVYKSVDKDGNVVYTDQPPEPGAEPMELPGLSVIASLPTTRAVAEAAASEEDDLEQVTDIRELRQGYKDFHISSPQQEETIEGTGNSVTLSWNSRYALQSGMAVIFSLDGVPLDPTVTSSVNLQQIDRGAHTVTARLVDSQLRIIAQASPVTFYMRQWSQNFGR